MNSNCQAFIPLHHRPCPSGNVKTRLCRNWIQTAKCRYRDTCHFAHGQDELTYEAVAAYGDMFKSKNCRTFYSQKTCMYGAGCMFRHEHHIFHQLHRHFYKPQMFKLETQYESAPDKEAFIRDYMAVPERLPVFKAIHQIHDDAEAERQWGAALASVSEDSSENEEALSDTEYPEIGTIYGSCKKIEQSPCPSCKHGSSLNTTVDSEDFPQKVPQFPWKFPTENNSTSALDTDEDSFGGADDSEDIPESLRSLGLDFIN